VIDSGRYGPTRTKQPLLIGRDGRCNLIMSAAFDFDRLAAPWAAPLSSYSWGAA
jgi:hypothetical protein